MDKTFYKFGKFAECVGFLILKQNLHLTVANMTSANRNATLKRYSNNFKIFREGF